MINLNNSTSSDFRGFSDQSVTDTRHVADLYVNDCDDLGLNLGSNHSQREVSSSGKTLKDGKQLFSMEAYPSLSTIEQTLLIIIYNFICIKCLLNL